ncbi:MAG: hypothetical protein GPOALKHO_000494 [Sodalis sp.]|nr:MAG: hypothetical protein GPOALKHO_000494 [Sodalis sp.]
MVWLLKPLLLLISSSGCNTPLLLISNEMEFSGRLDKGEPPIQGKTHPCGYRSGILSSVFSQKSQRRSFLVKYLFIPRFCDRVGLYPLIKQGVRVRSVYSCDSGRPHTDCYATFLSGNFLPVTPNS